MERVLQGTAATITKAFRSGSTVIDPGTVAVTVTSDDGTVVASGNAGGTGAAERSCTLTPTHTALLDRLAVSWVSVSLGTLDSTVEVVGDFLFTVDQARQLRPLDNATAYPDAQIQAMRTTVEDAIEDACGVAFVPRYERATLSGDGTPTLRVGPPFLRRVRWASTTALGVSTALTASDLLALSVDQAGFVYGYSWPTGYGNVTVGYEHGMDRPPERIRRAALLLAKVWLVSGPVDDRAATFSSSESGATYSMVVPGRGGSTFGVPEVDATVDSYRFPVVA